MSLAVRSPVVLRRPPKAFDVGVQMRPVDGAGIVECPFDEVARLVETEFVGDCLGGFKVFDEFGFELFPIHHGVKFQKAPGSCKLASAGAWQLRYSRPTG